MALAMTENDDKRFRSEVHRRQRNKNIAVALAIVGFCVVVYFVSIIKMSGGAG